MSRPEFYFGGFVDELRKRRGRIPQDLFDDLVASLEIGLAGKPAPQAPDLIEPAWLTEARSHIGTKEVPGALHNAKILRWIRDLGGWFTDDETPWCGTFVAACVQVAGHPVPKHWYRARAWAQWGRPSPARLGAVAVFSRRGGGHVGFLIGESATHFYVLGGNQSNMVNIAPISKDRLLSIRWPHDEPITDLRLARMSGGAVSRNEA